MEIASFLGKMLSDRQKNVKFNENKGDLNNKKLENKEIN